MEIELYPMVSPVQKLVENGIPSSSMNILHDHSESFPIYCIWSIMRYNFAGYKKNTRSFTMDVYKLEYLMY